MDGDRTNMNIRGPPRVNPMVPDSVGGLLAEEWTIDPTSTLPSFLERTMMDEARRSGIESLKTVFVLIEEYMSRLANSARDDASTTTSRNTSPGGATTLLWQRMEVLRSRWVSTISKFLAQNVLKPFGPEIRMLIIYFLERRCLLSSTSATISESIYGGKRVQLGSEDVNPTIVDGTTTKVTRPTRQRSLHPMSKQNAIRLALLMSLGPYLEERSSLIIQTIMAWLSTRARTMTNNDGNTAATAARMEKVHKFLQVFWPFLRMTTHGTFVLYQWRYLLGRSVFYEPYSSLLNLVLRRVTIQDQSQPEVVPSSTIGTATTSAEDSTANHSKSASSSLFKSLPFSSKVLQRYSGGQRVITGLMSTMVVMSWVARVRAIREDIRRRNEIRNPLGPNNHNNNNHNRSGNDNNNMALSSAFSSNGAHIQPIPPPPPRPVVVSDDSRRVSIDNLTPKVCPICQEPRIHPTASTGAYVFCLKCLLTYIRHQAPVCPVTGRPCPETSIIRLYEPRSTTTRTS